MKKYAPPVANPIEQAKAIEDIILAAVSQMQTARNMAKRCSKGVRVMVVRDLEGLLARYEDAHEFAKPILGQIEHL